jgi:peroxiredoxin
MAQLRQEYQQYQSRDAEVIAIGPEDAVAFRKYWVQEQLPFIGIPDPNKTVLKRYGQETNLFKLGRMPAQVVVDKNGIARYAHYGHDMTDIPSNEEMFAVLDQLNAQPVEGVTAHAES